jgi:hypothetical protein
MPIKHAFTSAITDDAVPAGKVQPSNWNANHDLSGLVAGDFPAALRPGAFQKDTATYGRSFVSGSIASAGHSQNAWRGTLVQIPYAMNITPMVYVQGAGAGAFINAALYNADPTTGRPLTKVVDLGTFDVSSIGAKTAAAVDIAPGEYWFVYVPSGNTTGTLTGVSDGGYTNRFTRVNLSGATVIPRIVSTSTAVSPLPATISGITWSDDASTMTCPVFFKVN